MKTLIRWTDKLLIAPVAIFLAVGRRYSRWRRTPRSAHNWVVINLVGMGDAVLLLPVLAAVRSDPTRHLTVITSHRCAGIFRAPGVAQAVLTPPRWRAMWRALRSADVVLDFEQHVFWSAALAALAGPGAATYGFATTRGRSSVYDHRVSPGPGIRHMKEIYDDLARSAGLDPASGLVPLPVTAAAAAAASPWRGYTVVAPGSGTTVTFRRLSARQWADMVAGLPPSDPVLMVGTGLEASLLHQIQELCTRSVSVKTDFSLQELAAVLAISRRVFSSDSGPMHLAAAMGAAVVGIFGPDTPLRYRPYNPRSTSVYLGLPCSPCNNCWVYREARCTNPERYACIRGLTTAHGLAAAGLVPGSGARRSAVAGHGADHHG